MAWRTLTTAQWEALRLQLPRPKPRPSGVASPGQQSARCGGQPLDRVDRGTMACTPPPIRQPQDLVAPAHSVGRARGAPEVVAGGPGPAPRGGQATLGRRRCRWPRCASATGGPKAARPNAARARRGWFWSMARGPPLGAVPGRGIPGRGHPLGSDLGHGGRRACRHARTPPPATGAAAGRSRV